MNNHPDKWYDANHMALHGDTIASLPGRSKVDLPPVKRTAIVHWRDRDGTVLVFETGCSVLRHKHRFYWEQGTTRVPLERHRDRYFLLGHGRI